MASLNPLDRENLGQTGFEADQGLAANEAHSIVEEQLGSGGEIQRGLERVAQTEAWLAGAEGKVIDLAALSGGIAELSILEPNTSEAPSGISPGTPKKHPSKTLVALDTSVENWEEVAQSLPIDSDLLLLDQYRNGVEQIQESIQAAGKQGSAYGAIAVIGRQDPDGKVTLGSLQFDRGENSATIELISSDALLANEGTRVQLFTKLQPSKSIDSSIQNKSLGAIRTRTLEDAASLLDNARKQLISDEIAKNIAHAIQRGFSKTNRKQVLSRLEEFISGGQGPKVLWSEFDDDKINGAFIAESNTILINKEIKNKERVLNSVIFEELGHWLESGLETDSEGDEGERFAQLIAGKDNQKQTGREYARLLINGKIIEAELSDTQSNIKQAVK